MGAPTVAGVSRPAARRPTPSRLRLATLASLGAAGAGVALPSPAGARPLIAPLDVRVTAVPRASTKITGRWDISQISYGDELHGSWVGPDVRLTETWRAGSRPALRVRGPRGSGPVRTHLVPFRYARSRKGNGGQLREVQPEDEPIPPTVLACGPKGGRDAAATLVDGWRTTVRVVDEPRRGRVVVWGPPVAFMGPECRSMRETPGGEECRLLESCVDRKNVVRGLDPLPGSDRDPRVPAGAYDGWRIVVPRAEFAAGGTFRFSRAFKITYPVGDHESSDVLGTALVSGRVAFDLRVRRTR